MIQLNEWEQLGVTLALSVLGLLGAKTKNTTALQAIKDASDFLSALLAGQVSAV
jgi:hypothetical protein